MLRKNRSYRKELRKASAEVRQHYSNSLKPLEKLDELDRRLGENAGAVKEREKLNYLVFG